MLIESASIGALLREVGEGPAMQGKFSGPVKDMYDMYSDLRRFIIFRCRFRAAGIDGFEILLMDEIFYTT